MLKQAIADLKKRNNAYAVETYISEYGKPAWDKSIEFNDLDNASTLITPVLDNKKQETTALIIYSVLNNKYMYYVVPKNGPYPTGKNVKSRDQWIKTFASYDLASFHKMKMKGYKKGYTIKATEAYEVEVCTQWCTTVNNIESCEPEVCEYEWRYREVPDPPATSNSSQGSSSTSSGSGESGTGTSGDYYSGENMDDSDDNTESSGPKASFPSSIMLNNGTIIMVSFGSTIDGTTANNQVSAKLIEAVLNALNIASQTVSITSIYIKATTNGSHHPESNHYRGLAVDISKINGQYIVNMGANSIITALQSAFESVPNRRENFGPAMKQKLGQPWTVPGHADHLHFSVNGD